MGEAEKVVVIGGGLVGALAALTMADLGLRVQLIERRQAAVVAQESEMEQNGKDKSAVKRSINLALSRRGQEALKRVGLLDWAMSVSVPMYGRAIHVGDTRLFQRYDEIDESNYINSISREELNNKLLERAEAHPKIEVLYNKQLAQIDTHNVLHFFDTDKIAKEGFGGTFNDFSKGTFTIEDADLTLGCDGAYSTVRSAMLRLQSCDFSRRYIKHSYKELEIKAHPETGDYQLDHVNALHIWPRGDFMMIALPNPDKSFTCTLFAPNDDLNKVHSDEEIEAYFAENFPDVIPFMPDYVEQYKRNPACRLVMSNVSPWNLTQKSGAQVVVLGDAAHAMVPFFGQGMNCGLEDALELAETIVAHNMNLGSAVPEFAATRMPRSNAAVQLSLLNYEEMRSHTASRMFLFRKRIEGYLNWVFPTTWIPLYKMVAFTRIPYDEAVRREAKQSSVLHALTHIIAFSGLAATAVSSWALLKHRRA
mmetsp:Transcript_14587/g.26155  ORF Transcript_14587/g.26155 Transcript_14587/m.26155 type:complete len:479 (-) Transcript_14587:162-1598(-)|eukprot:CAMPEP_0184525872 /NCGR_PEP_ID=MMETSP0198_2-20121128/10346_1 /TAXON_ID=1112570 /ORGANISM="Thraustochytrium sp., Strain LLF1b" /LENGTH=478 /DNA_ID=CAMNT_0026917393 /DNA_START=154 /DNA_END=1590 /DNA_ORIENTATION=-